VAHNLKNTLGLLAMGELTEIARQIEASPAATSIDEVDGLARSVDTIVAALDHAARSVGPWGRDSRV